MATYRWDDVAGRFRDSAGRYVADSSVRRVVDDIANHASERAAAASTRLLAGELSLASWQTEMAQVVKLSHVSASMLAHGGAASMTPAKWGATGADIKGQYRYLNTFAQQIASGEQKLDRTIVSRAEMYGQHARVLFEAERGKGQADRGYQSCRNHLHASESCASCRSESARGWVAMGTLIPIGSRTCLSRCRCTIDYRKQPADGAATATPPEPTTPEPVAPTDEIRTAMLAYAAEHEARVEAARERLRGFWDKQDDATEELSRLLMDENAEVNDPRVLAINKRIDRLVKQMNMTKEERDALNTSLLDEIRQRFIYHKGVPADPLVRMGAMSEASQREWREGVEAFRKIVGAGHGIDGKHVIVESLDRITGNPRAVAGRAYYDHLKQSVNLHPGDSSRIVVHELGHWLDESGGLNSEVVAYLQKRTQGETARPLGAGYDPSEVSKPDKLYRAYMGKQYASYGANTSSELLSTAIESLYAEPIEFAQKDPETFDWVLSLLRRKNRR